MLKKKNEKEKKTMVPLYPFPYGILGQDQVLWVSSGGSYV